MRQHLGPGYEAVPGTRVCGSTWDQGMRQYLGPGYEAVPGTRCGSNLDTVWVQPGHGVGPTWTRCGSNLDTVIPEAATDHGEDDQ